MYNQFVENSLFVFPVQHKEINIPARRKQLMKSVSNITFIIIQISFTE